MDFRLISRHKPTILYGICLAVILFLLKWLELRFIILTHAFEIYAGAIAFLFTGLGIWLASKLTTPNVKTIVVEKEVYLRHTEVFKQNEGEIARLGLSRRELEVLQLIAEGLSNQQIAERLFLSLNTIKTHSSRLFEKMDVKSRTQAVEQGRRLHIIA